ncbi:MAG: hypothetical protein Q7U37_06030 [Gallionella sp.]|nr:hypothetical protein [Gallionella sp.]MDP1941488.1 hypothetical protein [Gallionella sp.]
MGRLHGAEVRPDWVRKKACTPLNTVLVQFLANWLIAQQNEKLVA